MFSFMPKRRKPGWMALQVQGDELALAHVLRRGALPEVSFCASYALDAGVLSALQRLRSRLRGHACTLLMPDGEYHLTALDAPAVPREERKDALRWLLAELVSYPVDSACIDVLDIPEAAMSSGRQAGVMVVSAAEAAVRARIAPFEQAGVDLQVIDIPELAQRNVAALFEEENRGLAFLRLDEYGMMLTLSYQGELVAVRRSEMNSRQMNGGNAEMRERLVLEVQRSLDNFDRQYSQIPVTQLLVACYPVMEGLLAELGEAIYAPVRALDLAQVMDFSAFPELAEPAFQAKHLLVLGAALRSAGGAA